MTANDVIKKARSYVGVAEKPNNDVVFNTAYYGHAVNGSAYPWCCVFVWYVFKQAGASQLFYNGQKTAYCPTLMSWFQSKGKLFNKPEVGDVVFFNFSGKKVANHVGIVSEVLSGNRIKSIEGNTSSSNQTNGGQVEEKIRDLKYCVGFGRPEYDTNTAAKTTTSTPVATKKTDPDVLFHEAAKNGVQFTVTASALKMRKDAPDGSIIKIVPKGSVITWYGYHKIVGNDLWLLVSDGKSTGYMCKSKGDTQYMK